jgi:hypothetical protein
MEMRLRLAVSIIVLVALAAHCPSFAKEAHPQHSAHAVANKGASGKNPSANSHANSPGTKDAGERKSNSAIDLGTIVPPPVLPPQGFARQRDRNAIPSVKIVTQRNAAAHNRTGATTPHAVRNAIGQPIVQSKNFPAVQPRVSPLLQASGAMPPPVGRGTTAANAPSLNRPPLAGEERVGVTTLASRSSNGAGVIRPAVPPAGVGGPARPAYGINGTTVQNKH